MEWFNDSLKIYLFQYWMNQCFWTDLLNELLKVKYIFNSQFSPTKKKRCTQEFIGGTEIVILQQAILELEFIFDSQP